MRRRWKREREERALDALLVSGLRRTDQNDEIIDPDQLPQLTEDEKAAMKVLGSDFIQRLLAGERRLQPKAQHPEEDCIYKQGLIALAGSGDYRGLNRAEEIDGDTTDELERRKREILERKARERNDRGSRES